MNAAGKPAVRGEITAYLSLTFILLVTFVGAVMESASIQTAKNYRRADMNRAIECVFAEYQRELLEEYDIFALEAGYETGRYEEAKVKDRLSYYGAANLEQEILRVQFLTDNGCQAFLGQVAAYMEHKYGLEAVSGLLGKTDVWRQQEEQAERYEREESREREELDGLLAENGGALPAEDNPIGHMDAVKRMPFLTLAAPKEMQISEKRISLADTVSHRQLNRGYGNFSDVAEASGTVSALLFGEYILEHFSAATDGEKTGALDYELEYILEGKESDRENLEAAAGKLLFLRYVPNYLYLQSDAEMRAEAEMTALTLCSLLAVPAVTEAAAQVILLAWAYGESVMDIRSLLAGNRVPLVKSKESWQLSLSSLMKLGTEEDFGAGKDTEGGLRYRDYLRMLLFLEDQSDAAARALDLIERKLASECGQTYFRADQCISRIEFSSTCRLRRGITYTFPTYFGYN